VFAELLREFPGPVLRGFPTGHTTTPLLTIPLGAAARVIARGTPALVLDEAAAA
jgi:muramoyltetrapeptide carboxypeptidase LdcA involved in peptidoglycan recycling